MRLPLITTITFLVYLISCSRALESGPASDSSLEARGVDEDGWFTLSVGARMKRDESSSSSFEKRSQHPMSTPILLTRSPETGKLAWPRSLSDALTIVKRQVPDAVKSSFHRRAAAARSAMRVVITWYTGHDLLFPACFADSDNWAPTDDSMVAAVTIEWPGKPKCGAFVKIQHGSDPKKSILVRIVDSCGGCAPGKPHIDLTIAAFEKLYPQDTGMVENLKAKVVSCPAHIEENWTQDIIDRFGPKVALNRG
ncbi:hypothetical protein MJO28_008209 [Puccinia striiformis f. sp. tritici]|uniref:RlpA-like protein double-psi beta-barrel domain-containing protein n=3 Tax=Puccinia striiformis TaxID=27350 RepID=A0A0L0VFW2_9BASI|nr:hypothetical protein Pst134EA_015731 [Puccinia striiformis f. sp. tritici]KAI9602569.1 hypothetical protein H4Q26_001859 [Puccinia striiformis f. sp. tritici PST-130]KNE98081.1 hypothetical protein PSTG_08755 [Puccinia striiformis f. sp. tritici PST-78]POW22503.1 hypothetical protein PSHT_01242 [Puccinia striiformis]KAH9452874.1 hypothetical protein Pst134EB_016825 [Puccinia striiformis f. sp. tritici]KAH9463646.1 hypothetical protein Pst134EA_015731 [Puccinia striiformis f. sp. tritici]